MFRSSRWLQSRFISRDGLFADDGIAGFAGVEDTQGVAVVLGTGTGVVRVTAFVLGVSKGRGTASSVGGNALLPLSPSADGEDGHAQD